MDATIDQMEQTRIINKNTVLIEKLTKRTHFNRKEVQNLVVLYFQIKKQNIEAGIKVKGITKQQFTSFLHDGLDMTDASLHDRIISALETKKSPNSQIITLETWVCGLSVLLRGNLEELIAHCFMVYNPTNEALIGRDVLFNMLRGSLFSSGSDDDAEEALKDMIDVIIKKFDLDRDGKISFQDYRGSVLKQRLLLQAFGPCLPSRKAAHTFESTIFSRVYKF